MRFYPYGDETIGINCIQSVQSRNYELIRLTKTMVDKNTIDVKSPLQEILKTNKIVNFEWIKNEDSSIPIPSILFSSGPNPINVQVNFYKANHRGDPRMSISGIRTLWKQGLIRIGDLIYISCSANFHSSIQLFLVNLTTWIPSKKQLESILGLDPIMTKLQEIKPALAEILNGGFFRNSKGAGRIAPKDVGDTLESLLNVTTNNKTTADLDGLIELKTKGSKGTLDTLFTLRPQFTNTYIEQLEPVDRNRVSAFTRQYGYYSDKHPNCKSLYVTIGSKENPQNNQGLYLEIDEKNEKVSIKHINDRFNQGEVAFWTFESLRKQLENKHPATLWISSESMMKDETAYFKYTDVTFTRAPTFTAFLALISSGEITYDWRGYTSSEGKYSGKNHGNSFRIKPKSKSKLFGETEHLVF